MRVREWCSAHGEGVRWAKEKGKLQRRKSYAQNIKEGGNPQEVELGKSGENDKEKMRREGEIQRRQKSNIRWRDAGLKKFKRRNDMGPEKEGRNFMVKKKQTDGKQTRPVWGFGKIWQISVLSQLHSPVLTKPYHSQGTQTARRLANGKVEARTGPLWRKAGGLNTSLCASQVTHHYASWWLNNTSVPSLSRLPQKNMWF